VYLASTEPTVRAIRSSGISRSKRRWGVIERGVGVPGFRRIRGLEYPTRTSTSSPRNTLPFARIFLTRVSNPYFGQITASSSLGAATIAQQQLLRPYPRFTTVALFRDNSRQFEVQRCRGEVGEAPFSRSHVRNAAFTFSKMLERRLERLFTNDLHGPGAEYGLVRTMPTIVIWRRMCRAVTFPTFSPWAGVYDIPRVWKISGLQIRGIGSSAGGRRRWQ
jgi:hypothetical protein